MARREGLGFHRLPRDQATWAACVVPPSGGPWSVDRRMRAGTLDAYTAGCWRERGIGWPLTGAHSTFLSQAALLTGRSPPLCSGSISTRSGTRFDGRICYLGVRLTFGVRYTWWRWLPVLLWARGSSPASELATIQFYPQRAAGDTYRERGVVGEAPSSCRPAVGGESARTARAVALSQPFARAGATRGHAQEYTALRRIPHSLGGARSQGNFKYQGMCLMRLLRSVRSLPPRRIRILPPISASLVHGAVTNARWPSPQSSFHKLRSLSLLSSRRGVRQLYGKDIFLHRKEPCRSGACLASPRTASHFRGFVLPAGVGGFRLGNAGGRSGITIGGLCVGSPGSVP